MDYQTFRPMTIPPKPRKTFTRSNFAEHNYNYTHPSKTNHSPRKTNNNHVCSHYWDKPMTTNNSVNVQSNQYPPQDHSENYSFFQQNKNRKQTPHRMDYLSSDDDYLQPDIFAPYTQEYRTQKPRRPQTSQNVKNYPQNPADIQSYQPLQTQNPINIESYEPAQSQKPVNMHSYQPTQMQNEIPLRYYLQQHEITKNQLQTFHRYQMPLNY